jgi:hypothetical protein
VSNQFFPEEKKFAFWIAPPFRAVNGWIIIFPALAKKQFGLKPGYQ